MCGVGHRVFLSNCIETRLVEDSLFCKLPNGLACYDPVLALPRECQFVKMSSSEGKAPLLWECHSSKNHRRNPDEAGFYQSDVDHCIVVEAK